MFEKDSFDFMIRINRLTLQFFGILPLKGPPSIWKERFTNFLLAFTIFCITSILLPVLHFMLTKNLDLEGILDVLTVVAGVVGAEFRMIFIVLNRRKIQHMIVICEALWQDATSTDYKIIFPWAKRARLLTIALCLITSFAVSLYIIFPLIKQFTPGYDIGARSWPYQINMDPSQSPRYEIFFFLQSICAFVGTSSITGCDSIGPLLTLHACGQLKLIQHWLLDISREEGKLDDRNYYEHLKTVLKKCIRRHQVVMNFCAELEEAFCYANLAQALGGMYMLAISASRLTWVLQTKISKDLGPVFLAICQILVFCWPAEYLIFESTMVANAIYAIPWYRCSSRIRETIRFMIARSQRPAYITAGKFVTFSLATFYAIVHTATSLFMLLRTIDYT